MGIRPCRDREGAWLLEAFQTLQGVAESENKYELLNPQAWQGTPRDTCGEGQGRAELLQVLSATLQLRVQIVPSFCSISSVRGKQLASDAFLSPPAGGRLLGLLGASAVKHDSPPPEASYGHRVRHRPCRPLNQYQCGPSEDIGRVFS